MDLTKLDIATLVRIARAKRGMTQKEFSDFFGVTQKTVSNWEAGNTFPSAKYFREIIKILEE